MRYYGFREALRDEVRGQPWYVIAAELAMLSAILAAMLALYIVAAATQGG